MIPYSTRASAEGFEQSRYVMLVQKLNLSHHDIVVGNEIAEAAFSKELVDQLSRDM